ncbi:hypothetical protein JHK82_015958 [Glycine max]|nr:hypothetical protein JHK82_015958 [Glycine max]
MERILLITNNQTPRPHLIPPKPEPLKLHPKSPLTLLDRELQSTVVHRWTRRYEAHLWDNSCRRDGQTRKGRQGMMIYNQGLNAHEPEKEEGGGNELTTSSTPSSGGLRGQGIFHETGTDITAECVINRYHIKFQSFLNFLRRGFYALVPTVAWEALSRVIISVPKEALPSYIKLVRDAVSTSRDKERRKKKGGPILIPGFCLPEALQPILPIFLQSDNSNVERSGAAQGLSEIRFFLMTEKINQMSMAEVYSVVPNMSSGRTNLRRIHQTDRPSRSRRLHARDCRCGGRSGGAAEEREESGAVRLLIVKKQILGNAKSPVSAHGRQSNHEGRDQQGSNTGEQNDKGASEEDDRLIRRAKEIKERPRREETEEDE